MSIKPAKAAVVTRTLTAAGMRKTEWHASKMVRGWGRATPGISSTERVILGTRRVRVGEYADGRPRYTTRPQNTPTGIIEVEYTVGESGRDMTEEQRKATINRVLDQATDILIAKGYTVERDMFGAGSTRRLLVSRRDADGNVIVF